jgi:short subunit dehydrogenase-like uncharacterized protein
MPSPLVIYGAYGYTGALVARRAVERGLAPVLAGRDSEPLAKLARELSVPWRAFPLGDADAVRRGIEDAGAVLHCAGPFARTFRPMAEACLEARVHYLDLTGEIPVFQALAEMGPHAERAGVMLLPGAGFDVVPTDCLAAHLVRRLPGARSIVLAFEGLGRVSRGTARTMMSGVRLPGRGARPSLPQTRKLDLGAGPVTAVSIPWADTFTGPRSTGVADVKVYAAGGSLASRALLGAAVAASALVRRPAFSEAAARVVSRFRPGPTDEERARGEVRVYGEAVHADGRRAVARLRGPEPYTLTALAAVEIAERTLRGEARPGWQTPSLAFGPDLVLSIPGVVREDLPDGP